MAMRQMSFQLEVDSSKLITEYLKVMTLRYKDRGSKSTVDFSAFMADKKQ